jgi:hypothetical protein
MTNCRLACRRHDSVSEDVSKLWTMFFMPHVFCLALSSARLISARWDHYLQLILILKHLFISNTQNDNAFFDNITAMY